MLSVKKLTKIYSLCFDIFLSGKQNTNCLVASKQRRQVTLCNAPTCGRRGFETSKTRFFRTTLNGCAFSASFYCSVRGLTYSGAIVCRLSDVSPITTRLFRHNSLTHAKCLFIPYFALSDQHISEKRESMHRFGINVFSKFLGSCDRAS